MKTRHQVATLVAVIGAALFAGIAGANGDSGWTSASGHFEVTYQSALDPIELNTMHEWTVHVATAQGEPVEDAEITIDGGMPAHNHGLPTKPRVTENLGGGDYRVQGLRFHMRGEWQVRLRIQSGDIVDNVTITLQL